jgi:hypothetical protein
MKATVKGKGRGDTVFRKVVKKLPGPVDAEQCTWKVNRDTITRGLLVKKNFSHNFTFWKVYEKEVNKALNKTTTTRRSVDSSLQNWLRYLVDDLQTKGFFQL